MCYNNNMSQTTKKYTVEVTKIVKTYYTATIEVEAPSKELAQVEANTKLESPDEIKWESLGELDNCPDYTVEKIN